MDGKVTELLHAWHDFYVLIGTAAGTLIGHVRRGFDQRELHD